MGELKKEVEHIHNHCNAYTDCKLLLRSVHRPVACVYNLTNFIYSISGFATLIQLALATISIITSFQLSIGPGKHQCKQSFWTLAFWSFANG